MEQENKNDIQPQFQGEPIAKRRTPLDSMIDTIAMMNLRVAAALEKGDEVEAHKWQVAAHTINRQVDLFLKLTGRFKQDDQT